MYIQRNKSKNKKTGKEYSAVFLCSKYREDGKVKTRVEANLSHLPDNIILGIENMLRSDDEVSVRLKDIKVTKCIDYGFVLVLLHIIQQLRIDQVLEKNLSMDDATLVKAMLIGKIITGGSKLCIYNYLCREQEVSRLLGLDMSSRKVDHLYYSLGQLRSHQPQIEKKWFRYHKGAFRRIYLYDLTSTYFEGTQNELAAYGYNRDGKKGKKQMCVGLLTTEDGFPLRIQAFAGNTSDSATVTKQIHSLKEEFGVEEIVFIGDRGMHITYHLENDAELAGEEIQFITGLTHAQIQTLISQGNIQLSLFNNDLAEVTVEDKRYILSVNPDLELKELAWLDNHKERCDALIENIRKAWTKRCTQNAENLQKKKDNEGKKKYSKLKTELNDKDIDGYKRRVEHIIKSCGMSGYYAVELINNQSFQIEFNTDKFNQNRALCGKYVVCTNVCEKDMTAKEVRGQYKNLQNVEHAFRDLKSDNISIRPVYHQYEKQTRGHVLLCMFAYAIIKTMEDKLFPFLKEYNKKNKTKLAFNDLTAELNNIKMCELKIGKGITYSQITDLNELQQKILELLKIDPKKMKT